jgi:hypothetical protein
MKIIHRVGLRASPGLQAALRALGIDLGEPHFPESSEPMFAFDVAEDHAAWPEVTRYIAEFRWSDIVRTEFTRTELKAARWSAVAAWQHGYPHPDDDFGYRALTYDLSHGCQRCGIGWRQRAPFRMKAEPKWGRRGLMQLHWVDDELFVRPDVWAAVFAPAGVQCRPVCNRKGVELTAVVQLVVDEEVGVDVEGLPSFTCPACSRTKWHRAMRGRFGRLRGVPRGPMARTIESFGSGAAARRPILMGQSLARVLHDADVRGAALWPLADESVDA